jgi:peroxiredoxin family protein
MSRQLVLFLHGADWQSRYQATTLAATAAALGDPVELALFFGALQAWVEDRFDEGRPPEADGARVASLRTTLDEVRRDLGVRVVACDTAIRLAGFEPARIAGALDAVVSLPSLWRLAQQGQALVF